MDQIKLDEIIHKHDLWLRDKEDGERANLSSANLSYANLRYADLSSADLRSANLSSANLSYANLSYADLSSANLRSANLSYANLSYANLSEICLWASVGNLENIKSLQTDKYEITYTAEVMQIGCEQHDIKDWWGFDDETIDRMDRGSSLIWWKIWKPILKKIIKVSPALPTGFVEDATDQSAA